MFRGKPHVFWAVAVVTAGLSHSATTNGQVDPIVEGKGLVQAAPANGDDPPAVEDQDFLGGVFLPKERNLIGRLKQAEELVKQQRHGEAVRFLGAILDSEEDSFFNPGASKSVFRSLKLEARRLVGRLPEAGRDAYRLQYGARAKKLLEKAAETGEVARIAEVSRRFFHTEAGYEATLLLSRLHLDQGRSLAAALGYQQLQETPEAARRFDPALSIMAATAWARAGLMDKARETLADLKKRDPQAIVEVGGAPVELFGEGEDSLVWLDDAVGVQSPVRPGQTEHWAMFRGNPARNGESNGGRPLMTPRWRVRTANHPQIEHAVKHLQQNYESQDIVALPVLHPLAVGDVVLMRTALNLLAVDIHTGKRVWELRPYPNDPLDQFVQASGTRWPVNTQPQLEIGLEQRMWSDSPYGTLSSDGERVFVIQDLGPTAEHINQRIVLQGRRGAGWMQETHRIHNRLSALELKTEGKLVWEVGGADSQVEELKDAFFLGPPLARAGRLYVLAEIKRGIRLIVLDAETGSLEWSQQLADLELSIAQDPTRRLAGATPSYADGVLVCPTSAGATVAVDLTTRSLLWAWKYRQRNNRQPMHARGVILGRGRQGNRKDGGWVDATATIVDRYVILTPVESDEIFCLNLIEGNLVWKQSCNKDLYVGCVHENKVILVGRTGVRALSLADGKPAWNGRVVTLPDSGRPSGRGFYSDGKYYLPATSAEVITIDLADGEIVERAKSRDGQIPGNLICYRGEVISQGVDHVETYYQIGRLKARVETALAQDADNAEALARLGQIELDEGNVRQAITHFRRSFELDANDLMTRELLIEALLQALRDDFSTSRDVAQQLEKLIDQPDQRLTLLRLMADGLHQMEEWSEAFETYMKIVDLGEDEQTLEIANRQISVRADRWIRSRLAKLRSTATDEMRAEMDMVIKQRLTALGDDASAEELRRFLRYFDSNIAADDARQRLASRLLETEELLECEWVLLRLLKSSSEPHRRSAVALMAQMLHRAKQWEHATDFYRRLAGPLSDEICLAGMTGSELVESLAPEDPVRLALSGAQRWPHGKVEVSHGDPIPAQAGLRGRSYPLPLEGPKGPFFRDVNVSHEQRTSGIVGHDGFGRERFRISLKPTSNSRIYINNQSGANYGAVHGHLLVVSMGHSLLAIDTLNRNGTELEQTLWQQKIVDRNQNLRAYSQTRRQRNGFRGRPRRRHQFDRNNRAIGVLGPISDHGMTFQRYGELICVDPLTGSQQWVRHDLPAGCELFGDDELLFVVPPNAKEATVFRTLDGIELGKRKLPAANVRTAMIGRHVVQWQQEKPMSNSKITLRLFDLWDQADVWSRRFDAQSQPWLLDHDSLGVLEPSGKFVLISLSDGTARIDQQLEPEPKLNGIILLQSRDQYLLFTNGPPASSDAKVSVTSPAQQYTKGALNGRVYAFDRGTGEPQWSVPVTLRQRVLLLDQPSELPVLAFIQTKNPKTRPQNRAASKTSVLFIDKRTGNEVYRQDDLSQLTRTASVKLFGDPAESTVTLQMTSVSMTLKLTDEPVPPQPPARWEIQDANKKPKPRGLFGILGAIPRAVVEAAGELSGKNIIRSDQEDVIEFNVNPIRVREAHDDD